VIDWEPMVRGVLTGIQEEKSVGRLAAAFHNTLIEIIVAVAKQCALKKVVLSGGCFQNRYLTEQAVIRLRQEGFSPYWHQRVPPNDGGIALGQVAAAALIQRNARLADSFPRA
jgi:hydrogenase maturation protein HypF